MKAALFVTLVVGAALGFSMREGIAATPTMWLGLLLPHFALAVLAVYRLYQDGTLRDAFRIRSGDLTIGFLLGGVLVGGAYGVRQLLFGSGSPRIVWLYRVAMQVGSFRPSPLAIAAILSMAALEELVWRGLVLGALTESLGTRRAWPLCAVLYAIAHVATVFTLSDPMAGPNPLLVLAALGAGIVWSFAASTLGRLPLVIVSHAVFSYFAAMWLLPRLG